MKPLSRAIVISAFLSAWLCSTVSLAIDTKTEAQQVVIENIGLATPESIEYYAAEDVYLVSNINGNALEVAGNGFISKIKPDGSVINLKWIDGTNKDIRLNAPKGIAIQGNQLFVADINQVHIFELPGGKQQKSVHIKGSTFLNGITSGGKDFVYVTDSGLKPGENGYAPSESDAIYKVWSDGHYKLVIKDKNMGHPNGIVSNGDEIILVTFGSGDVIRIDSARKQRKLPAPPKGELDGMLMLDDGRFLISSWGESAIYVMNKNNTYSILADSLDAPADLGLDTKRNRLLIPLFKQNKLVFLALTEVKK